MGAITISKLNPASRVLARRGLSESLETYASRCGMRPHEARHAWRIGAIYALFNGDERDDAILKVADGDGVRVAPGLSVPTKRVHAGEVD